MDPHPHIPAPNHSNREVSARGIPWNGVEEEEEEEEEEDWSIDQSSGDEEDVVKEPPPYSRLHFDNSETRTPKNQHLFADDLEDDEEDELGKGDEEYEDEDDDGIDGEEDDDPDWDDNNRQVNGAQQQLERQQHNGSSQTDTSGEGEDGRNYYLQNDDDIYVDRLNAPEGIGGEEEFESPTEENHDQSGDQTEQEMIKAEEEEDEEQGEESGYNDLVSEPLREQGVPQDEDKDAEQMVPANPKTPGRSAQKRKSLSSMGPFGGESGTRKPKKKNTNVWTKTSSRKGSKKNKSNGAVAPEETAFITPVPRLPDKVDDSPDMRICLSKIYKAEKVELSEDRLTAGSTKGYRMVRATRGVIDGAWYFEIKIVHLGETGHTRLGWSTEKGDVQAPVGYDGNSYSYRDVDGSKVHKAVREPYGEGPYREGDVIGFYINLPGGAEYAPRPPQYVVYRGQLHCRDSVEEPPKIVPDISDLLDFNSVLGKGFGHTCGSEISFFKNGICQGVAFKNINAGRYYPAASMYTLPNQPNCTVQFNFGPQFDCFPEDFGDRPLPKAMYEAPYCGIDGRVVDQGESLLENGQSSEKKV